LRAEEIPAVGWVVGDEILLANIVREDEVCFHEVLGRIYSVAVEEGERVILKRAEEGPPNTVKGLAWFFLFLLLLSLSQGPVGLAAEVELLREEGKVVFPDLLDDLTTLFQKLRCFSPEMQLDSVLATEDGVV
jgi:hypothetical protein